MGEKCPRFVIFLTSRFPDSPLQALTYPSSTATKYLKNKPSRMTVRYGTTAAVSGRNRIC